jgi:hypothetical protein
MISAYAILCLKYGLKNTGISSVAEQKTAKHSVGCSQCHFYFVVNDNQIKTNADGYARGIYFPSSDSGQSTYTLSINITVNSKDLAQKVQDYLITTSPSGAITPFSSFSKTKQNQLQLQARDAAEIDARDKAVKSAKNLGFKLGAVKTISDTNGFGVIEPLLEKGANSTDIAQPSAGSGISVRPGQNDINYQISVTYFIK